MGALDGRVAIITGAGRGIGREHALLFAAEGARVVVNDVGGAVDGSGTDGSAAQAVVDEIVAAGGHAVANTESVTDWAGAQRMVDMAVEVFGDLHVVVNNAGIIRDRTLVNMSEEEFDAVVDVHLKGTFAVSRWAATYWRARSKAGATEDRAIVNTSSGSGLHGNRGQYNYAAAKAGIAAMTLVSSMELAPYGVRSNCIAPFARTRMMLQTPGLGEIVGEARSGSEGPDVFDAGNIAPLVAYLCTADCPFDGQVFSVHGAAVGIYQGWSIAEEAVSPGHWTVESLADAMEKLPRTVPVRSQADSLPLSL